MARRPLKFWGTYQPPSWLRCDITESRPRGRASDVQASSHYLQGESLDTVGRALTCNPDPSTRSKWQEHFPHRPFSTCGSSDQENPLWHLWDGMSMHVDLIPVVHSSVEAATRLPWIRPKGATAHRIPRASVPHYEHTQPPSVELKCPFPL